MNNETRQRGEGQDALPETEEPEAPCFETAEEQMDYWKEQFGEMADRAAHDGLNLVICLCIQDPINYMTHYEFVHRGSLVTNEGLLRRVLREVEAL